jgi:hypothetical protein
MTTTLARLRDAVNAHDAQRLASLFAENRQNAQPLHPTRGFGVSSQVLENWSSVFDPWPVTSERMYDHAFGQHAANWSHSGPTLGQLVFISSASITRMPLGPRT